MGAIKLHTLKQKLWAIAAASFFARVIVFFTLPNTPSSLGPDEGTYAALTKWVGESKSVVEFPTYGQGLYLSGRSIISPASILYRVGIHELDAVRLVSTMYGLSSLIMLVLVILTLQNSIADKGVTEKFNENLIIALLFIFAFLPSHFLWSNLGLRESATEFWLISTVVMFFIIFHYRNKITFPSLTILFGSIVLTFSARPQVGWVLGVSLILYLVFNLKKAITFALVPIVVFGVLLGSTLNLGTTGATSTRILNPLLNAGEVVALKQQLNQVDAASVIETQSCPRENLAVVSRTPTKIDTYFCIAWRAPYMVSTFLLRPIIGVDVTSTSSLIAAAENIIWLLLFITIIALVIKRRAVSFIRPILPALIFFALYVLGASAYQGNMGTGFRHKSLILWATLLLILALAWRKSEETSEKPRNNSQENAV